MDPLVAWYSGGASRLTDAIHSRVPPLPLIEIELDQSSVRPLDLAAVILHFHSLHRRKLPEDGVVIDHLQGRLRA